MWEYITSICCTEENWDAWQRPKHDDQYDADAEYTEHQQAAEDYEPHCDDPDFIVCIVTLCLCVQKHLHKLSMSDSLGND